MMCAAYLASQIEGLNNIKSDDGTMTADIVSRQLQRLMVDRRTGVIMLTDHRWSRCGWSTYVWRSIVNGRYATAVAILLVVGAKSFAAEGYSTRGQRVFGACAACHSLQPDQNMTGPSLADLWNRKAGSLPTFTRYSPALVSANIVWNDKTLDEWIADPQHLVPGNEMTFAVIKDARQRADLLAFLKQATQPGASVAQQGGSMGGMGGMDAPNARCPWAGLPAAKLCGAPINKVKIANPNPVA
jgi:cytochrome c2